MNTENPETPNENVPPEKPVAPPNMTADGSISGVDAPKEVKTMAMLAHLLGGLFGIVGALIIWLIKKDEHPFIDQEGKEATNFQITMIFAHLIGVVLVFISCGFLFFIPMIILVISAIFGIIAGLQANNGQPYRYPVAIRLVK